MNERGVDLLADDLLQIQEADRPHEATWGAMHQVPESQTPLGKCGICQERDAHHRCVHCAKVACRDHFWSMLGLCKECATEEEARAAREGLHRARPDLDIKWIED